MEAKNNTLFSWVILVTLALVWGSSFILIKKSLLYFNATEVGLLRVVLSFLFLLPVAVIHFRSISRKHFLYLTLSGFVGSLLPALLFAKAQTVIDSGLAGTLNSLTPLFTLLLGLLFFRLQTKWYNILGVFIAMAGAMALIYVSSDSGFTFNFKYAMLVVLATICYAFNVNFIKVFLKELTSLVITTFSFFYIGIPLTVYVVFFSDIPHKLMTDTTTHTGLGYLLILSIAGTGLALIFFNKLIKISSAVFASSVTYLIPVVAIIWALIDGEKFHWLFFICFLLILSGIFLVNASPYRKINISSWLLFRKQK
ncbi:MAG: DMT family transporter [Bacteroidales bacterium]|nr:DMT family transporter [Bacteroidales bacterium]